MISRVSTLFGNGILAQNNLDLRPRFFDVEYLSVAGGGGGITGGGGGGGFLTGTYQVNMFQLYQVTVGAGGSASNGSNSQILDIDGSITVANSIGGGFGGSGGAGGSGGSGGGGGASGGVGNTYYSGGSGTVGQGNAGGQGWHQLASTSRRFQGGGGGGATAVGSNYSSRTGGSGQVSTITGTSQYYSGGGGGAAFGYNTDVGFFVGQSNGGIGGGGRGGGCASPAGSSNIVPTAGTSGGVNTGGGSGGQGTAYDASLGYTNGGSGVVILKYPKYYDFIDVSNSITNDISIVGEYAINRITGGAGTFLFN